MGGREAKEKATHPDQQYPRALPLPLRPLPKRPERRREVAHGAITQRGRDRGVEPGEVRGLDADELRM